MAYNFSKGKRGLGDITFEDDADTGIDFEPDTIKLETNGQERVVVTNTNTLFNTPIRTTSIEYTDGDDAITIDDGGYLKFHSGVKYSRGVLVDSSSSPGNAGGWIKFATFNCPGASSLDTAASSFLVTFAGMESSGNRRIDGIFMVHAKFTVNTAGSGTDGESVTNAYYEPEGTRISCEPLNAEFMSANGATDFDPATDLLMIFTNTNSTPVVDLYIKCNAKSKRCFVTHLGGTGQTDTTDTDIGWDINTGQSWSSSEPTAPAGSVKITGTFVSKIFSKLGIATTSPISELDVAGKIAITAESSTPSQPADGQGYLYSKSDGKIYWRSYDVVETDLTTGGGTSTPGLIVHLSSDFAYNTSGANEFQTVPFNNILKNTFAASNFNTSSYIFTAPEEGFYFINVSLYQQSINTDTSQYQVRISSSAAWAESNGAIAFRNYFPGGSSENSAHMHRLDRVAHLSGSDTISVTFRNIRSSSESGTTLNSGKHLSYLTIHKL